MKDGRHIIWSNDIDYDDWREELEEQYPDLTEAERMELMYELNSDYLDDERSNLDIQLSRPILVVGDLGLWNGRRPEGLCAKMALSALEVPTSLGETLYSAVSILVSLLYSREAELQKAAAGVIFPTGLDVEKLKPSASDRKKRLEDAQRFLAMTARPKPLDPASAEKEFDALFGGDIAETDDDDPEPFR